MAVIDELITRYVPRMDPAAVRNVQRGFKQIQTSSKQLRADLAHVGRGMVTMLGAVGVASVGVGMKAERSFTKLRTQLGESNEAIDTARTRLRELSKGTGVALDKLGDAFFSLRSNSVGTEEAFDAVTAAAKANVLALGETRDIASLAGSAMIAFAKDGLTAEAVIAAIHETVARGNIADAGVLAQHMPSLIEPASQLGMELKHVMAMTAVYTRTQSDLAKAATGIDAMIQKLLAPGGRGQKMLGEWFGSVTNFHDLVGEDPFGAIRQLLEHMQLEEGEVQVGLDVQALLDTGEIDEDLAKQLQKEDLGRLDPVMLREFFEDKTALGFALNFASNEGAYREVLAGYTDDMSTIDSLVEELEGKGFHILSTTVNSLRLDLIWLYEKAVRPLLQLFNLLPDSIKRVVAALLALQVATALLGPLKGLNLGLWGTIMALGMTDKTARSTALSNTRLGSGLLNLTGIFVGFFGVLRGMFRLATWRNLMTGVGRAMVGLGPRIAGLVVSLKTFSGVAGLVSAAIRGISMAIFGIPFVGWALAAIAAFALLYTKSEGFKKTVDAIGKWLLAMALSIVERIVGLFTSVMDWFSGSAVGRWLADLFGGIDETLGDFGTFVEEGAEGTRGRTQGRRQLRRIESGEEGTWSRYPVGVLHDPVTPPPILSPAVAAVQAVAADSYYSNYSRTMLDRSARNVTVNAPVTIHATTGADADEIASAVGSAVQEAGRNMAEDNDSGRSE